MYSGTARAARKFIGMMAAVAVVATSIVAVDSAVSAQPAQAAEPQPLLYCDGQGVYTLNTNGGVREFMAENGNFTPTGNFNLTGQEENALGVSGDGQYVYSIDATNAGMEKQIAIHNRLTNQTETKALGDPDVPSGIIRGAVNPVDGLFYYGGFGEPAYLGVYNPATGDAYQVANVPDIYYLNGDFAFTADGQLILVADTNVYAVQGEVPDTPGNVSLDLGDPIATLPGDAKGNGIAFAKSGDIYVSTSSKLFEIDLVTGQTVNEYDNPGGGDFTDLASCSYPNTVLLQKDIQPDRYAATDQFALSVTAPGRAGGPLVLGTGETSGDAPGLQTEDAGPYIVGNDETLNLAETALGTANFDYYNSALECVDAANNDAPVNVTGTGPDWSIVQPDNLRGSSVVCTITNTALERSLELTKTSDPASGTAVNAGDEITYSVTATNTGEVAMDVEVSDDLTDVLAHAAVTETGFSASITDEAGNSTPTTAPTLDQPTSMLTWGGNLGVGEAVTLTYTVAVNSDAAGETLSNVANATSTPPGGGTPPADPPAVTTEHPVNVPGFELTKTVDPASGTAVNPGDSVNYEITASNTGETPLTDVNVNDDVSALAATGVVDEDSITATINGAPADPDVDLTDNELTWTGDLGVGETLTIQFSYTVGSEAAGQTLENTVTGEATPPGGGTITPPPSDVTTPVNEPGFELTKTSNPPSGEPINAGTEVTYTVTGSNTGGTPLSDVTITDDLSDALDHAELLTGPTATIDGEEVDGLTFVDNVATWTGDLAVGENVGLL